MFKHHKFHSPAQAEVSMTPLDSVALSKKVSHLVSENKRIRNEIQAMDRDFAYRLYQPITTEGIDPMFLRPLLLRQVGQLEDENQTLTTKKEVICLLQVEECHKKEQATSKINQYSFLRSTWTRMRVQGADSLEKIDGLNKIIGTIRNNILAQTENEVKSLQNQLQGEVFPGGYHSWKLYEQTQGQIEQLKMRNEELQTKYLNLQETICLRDQRISALEYELEQLRLTILEKEQENIKFNLDNTHQRQNNSEQHSNKIQFTGIIDEFQLKIFSNIFNGEMQIEQTQRKLDEIIDFLRWRNDGDCNQEFIDLPSLDLNIQLKQTHSTTVTTLSATQRYSPESLSKESKYIPMRTQRSQKTHTNEEQENKGVSEVENQEHLKEQSQQRKNKLSCLDSIDMINIVPRPDIDLNTSILGNQISPKRFIRRGDHDRLKKWRLDRPVPC